MGGLRRSQKFESTFCFRYFCFYFQRLLIKCLFLISYFGAFSKSPGNSRGEHQGMRLIPLTTAPQGFCETPLGFPVVYKKIFNLPDSGSSTDKTKPPSNFNDLIVFFGLVVKAFLWTSSLVFTSQ
jgi:hypothetical protein